jgi:hypothetical protein
MLSAIIQRFTRTSSDVPSTEAAELLASCSLPDPDDLRRQLAAPEAQRDADEARCHQIQHDHRAFLEQQAIAERRPRLRAQIDALRSRIAAAESRRAAFIALVRLLDEADETIAAQTAALYACVLTAPAAERHERMESLGALLRLRARLAGPLASVSSARRFRRGAPDSFGALQHDLRARANEIDRFHAPGAPRPAIPWPPRAQELVAALNEGRSA